MTPVTPDELQQLLEGSAPHALVDVRERATYETGHIFRATSLPRRLLEFRLPLLVTAPGTPLVVYDDDGGALGERAAATIAAMGYRDVRGLAGGLRAWRASGRRVAQGLNVPSKVFGERILHERKTPEIAPQQLRQWLAAGKDMVIVDSRTPEEYHRGCIPGAQNVPGGELVLRIGALVERPDTAIVVHCGGRTRSYLGAESLRLMDLPNPIVALRNGTMGWALAGLELERGATRWAPPVSAKSRALAETVATGVARDQGVRFVSPAELEDLRARRDRENVYVLDVRTREEYAERHIAEALWAPGGQLVQATDEYVAVRAGTVVLACDGFVRSALTAAWLGRMGLRNVAVLSGGLGAWIDAGGAVEAGHRPLLPFGYETARRDARFVTAAALHANLATAAAPTVLDVDQSDVYARGHVPGARWLCRSRLERTIGDTVPRRDTPLAVTCSDGITSTLAGATLARVGYRRIQVLEGGTRAWQSAGLALERGTTALGDEADDVALKPYDKGRAAMEAYLRWEEALDVDGSSPVELVPGKDRG